MPHHPAAGYGRPVSAFSEREQTIHASSRGQLVYNHVNKIFLTKCVPRIDMTKWQKDATEFTVSVTYHEARGCQGYLPKPIMERLGRPSRITYRIVRGKIEVTAAKG